MADEIRDKPSPIQPPKPLQPIAPGEEQQAPSRSFESYMKQAQASPAQATAQSPLNVAPATQVSGAAPSIDVVRSQMVSTSGMLGDVQTQLNTKNLKLQQSQKYLLRNKLTDVNESIRAAAEKSGAQVTPPVSNTTRQNPIAKYLALVNDSQQNLDAAQAKLQSFYDGGQTIEPGKLLLVQVKLAKAQQELEYASVLLSKAVDSVKMLFNVQL